MVPISESAQKCEIYAILSKVDIRLTEWRVDRKKNDDWLKKILIKFLYIL